MNRCEKLRDNLYGVELLTGSITPVKEHIAQIFYIVNDTALKIYPTDSEKIITRKYESTEKFADELSLVLQERYFVPTDFYLIYDDEKMYRQVVGMTE